MPSLFLRIFISFWLATLLVLATTGSVAWYRFQRDQATWPNNRQLASEASNRLLVGGMEDLYRWIEETEDRYPGRHFYVVGSSGQDILKRPLPPT